MFDLELSGKVALVTGGSDGLGRAASMRLAMEGATVVICGRRADHAHATTDAINQNLKESGSSNLGGVVIGLGADVTKLGDCENLVAKVISSYGGIDILVNNAGASAAMGLELADDDLWLADFNLKVMAAVRLSRLIIPSMKLRGGGAIINASIGGGNKRHALCGSELDQITGAGICGQWYSGQCHMHRLFEVHAMDQAVRGW